jgi:hypothetical protein
MMRMVSVGGSSDDLQVERPTIENPRASGPKAATRLESRRDQGEGGAIETWQDLFNKGWNLKEGIPQMSAAGSFSIWEPLMRKTSSIGKLGGEGVERSQVDSTIS